MFDGKKIFWVTGGHGFIGRNLSSVLSGDGRVVAGIGHGAWSDRERARHGFSYWLNSEISVGSLGHVRSVTGDPDAVFHLAGGSSVGAALANPLEEFRRTLESTAEILEWLRQMCPTAALVAVSSAAVYGSVNSERISESANLSPVSPYGSHKRMMEELCHSYGQSFGIRVVIPRLFSVYGPGLRKQLLWDICEKIKMGGRVELGGTGDERRDWIHVSDVSRNLISLTGFANASVPAVNIGTGVATTVRDVARDVIDTWELPLAKSEINFNGRTRSGDPWSLVANVDLMESMGLSTSISIRDGIAQYVNWYRSVTR